MSLTPEDLAKLSPEEKRRLAASLLAARARAAAASAAAPDPIEALDLAAYTRRTYDQFLFSRGREHTPSAEFARWIDEIEADDAYGFEIERLGAQRTSVEARRASGTQLQMVNLASYNYLGLGYHPAVVSAASEALQRYGLGSASSPVVGGTLSPHLELERALLGFYGLAGRGVSLFSSGYAVNVGTVAAAVHKGHHVVLDRSAHVSLLEGAQLSRASISYFRHNDAAHLDEVLAEIRAREPEVRILVCTEGVFSTGGDKAPLRALVDAAHRHAAVILVDEAHSILVAGASGRGVAEEEGVLAEVDMLVLTFSKAFGGIGGALVAPRAFTRYVNWYARCRMFSCAMAPSMAAGVTRALEIAASDDGARRRARVVENAAYLRTELAPHVDIGKSETWIVTVNYGDERLTLPVHDHLQRGGLDTSVMQFPAVPKNESRIRMFVSSEHTREELDRAVQAVLSAARRFDFARRGSEVAR